jgi:hypothetical protein
MCDDTPATRKSVRKLRKRLGHLGVLLLTMLVCLTISFGLLAGVVVKLQRQIEAAAAK